MVRKPKSNIRVSGVSINDILNMDVNDLMRMNRQDLAKVTSRLVSAANKRIRRLKDSAELSPALKTVEKSGKLFSIANKNVNAIRNEFSRIKNFLQLKTSTVSGFKKVQKNIEKRIGKMTPNQSKKYWEVYNKLQEQKGGIFGQLGSHQIQKGLYDTVKNNNRASIDVLLNNANDMLDELYEEQAQTEINDVFDFDAVL